MIRTSTGNSNPCRFSRIGHCIPCLLQRYVPLKHHWCRAARSRVLHPPPVPHDTKRHHHTGNRIINMPELSVCRSILFCGFYYITVTWFLQHCTIRTSSRFATDTWEVWNIETGRMTSRMVQKISGVYRLLNNPHLGEAVVVSNPYSGEVTEIVVHGHS